ncbi:hypothetical protein FQA39_LY18787 [Lamprigera yunnana]|nr:hypothetical protein FQA39_LY18787 [Lamprigera yunnana]
MPVLDEIKASSGQHHHVHRPTAHHCAAPEHRRFRDDAGNMHQSRCWPVGELRLVGATTSTTGAGRREPSVGTPGRASCAGLKERYEVHHGVRHHRLRARRPRPRSPTGYINEHGSCPIGDRLVDEPASRSADGDRLAPEADRRRGAAGPPRLRDRGDWLLGEGVRRAVRSDRLVKLRHSSSPITKKKLAQPHRPAGRTRNAPSMRFAARSKEQAQTLKGESERRERDGASFAPQSCANGQIPGPARSPNSTRRSQPRGAASDWRVMLKEEVGPDDVAGCWSPPGPGVPAAAML